MALIITSPEPLTDKHDLTQFSCGEASLDTWLKGRALKNEQAGASRTYVVCVDGVIVGYYSLAVGSIEHKFAPSKLKRNMPELIPVMILARLAVDQSYTQKNIDTGLLRDALMRTLQSADIAGIRALLVHALNDKAARFYANRGFVVSPFALRVLFLPLAHMTKQ